MEKTIDDNTIWCRKGVIFMLDN